MFKYKPYIVQMFLERISLPQEYIDTIAEYNFVKDTMYPMYNYYVRLCATFNNKFLE